MLCHKPLIAKMWRNLLLYTLLLNSCLCEKEVLNNKIQIHETEWKHESLNKSSDFGFCYVKKSFYKNTWLLEQGYFNENHKLLIKKLHFLAPTFTLSSASIRNERCKSENEVFLSALEELKLWALKMYDSSGKFSSGLLNGNVNQFGDFDQCLTVESENKEIKGKYCLAYFQINFKNDQDARGEIRTILDLIQSHNAFRSKLNDPGHRVPRFSTINWAFCIPSSCSHEEIQSQLKYLISRSTENLNFEIEVRVDEEMCQVERSFQLSTQFITVSVVLISFTIIVFVSTVKDTLSEKFTPNSSFYFNLLNCFSLKRNFKELTSTARANDDINSIHGIRMINALLLLLSHKSLAMFFFPYVNRTYLVENLSQPWTILARVASLYTDSFILISGILTAHSFSKTLKEKGHLNLQSEYLNRLIRIFPLLIITVLLSTFIVPEVGSGPQWGLTVAHHSNSCKNTWWKNFLFVHNYFGFENMCLTHTHHLGIDTQLFFLSPLLVFILYKWHFKGIGVLVFLAAISTGLRYQLTIQKNLSYFIYPGITVSQMMDTANFSYIIPSHRLTVYVMGLITGYILYQYGKEIEMKSHFRKMWWLISFGLFSYLISRAMNMNHIHYSYEKYEAAIYSAVAPIAWCLILSWIIFASHINCGGVIGRLVSFKYWTIWTKISYAVYLVQFPIFFYNVGRQRYPQEFTIFSLINIFEYIAVILSSIILTLFVDMPATNIRKLLKYTHWSNKPTSKDKL